MLRAFWPSRRTVFADICMNGPGLLLRADLAFGPRSAAHGRRSAPQRRPAASRSASLRCRSHCSIASPLHAPVSAHTCAAVSKLSKRRKRSASPNLLKVIRIAITEATLVAIGEILPEGTVLQIDRRRGQCFIHLEEAIVDRLGAMRGPRESYSDVILRLIEAWARRDIA